MTKPGVKINKAKKKKRENKRKKGDISFLSCTSI